MADVAAKIERIEEIARLADRLSRKVGGESPPATWIHVRDSLLAELAMVSERRGRPSFISREDFRSWMGPTAIGRLMDVGRRSGASYVTFWRGTDAPVRCRWNDQGRVYRPLDVVAHARARALAIELPGTARARQFIGRIPVKSRPRPDFIDDIADELRSVVSSLDALERQESLLRGRMASASIGLYGSVTGAVDVAARANSVRRLPSVLELFERSTPIPCRCGIYFLFSGNELAYVGQSVDVPGRVASHIQSKEFDRYAFVEVPAKMLDIVESIYIHTMSPPLNGNRSREGEKVAPMPLDRAVDELLVMEAFGC